MTTTLSKSALLFVLMMGLGTALYMSFVYLFTETWIRLIIILILSFLILPFILKNKGTGRV